MKYLLKRGATTFWEKWPIENDEGEEYTRSMSHPFQGGFVAWFFEGLAGISPDVDHPGYKWIHLEPQIFEGLDWVKCRYNSLMGTIKSSWKKEGGTLIWNIEIPHGAKAKLRIPGRLVKIESKFNMSSAKPVQADDAQGKAQHMELPSGKYQIRSEV